MPGAYSEAAALKAYPNCETVPCDQFEAAFKVNGFKENILTLSSKCDFLLSFEKILYCRQLSSG